jgi:hypothetical protein
MVSTPGYAVAAPLARLVHCGNETCLRISGRRLHSAVAVRIDGRDLAVEGERNWHTTVPLTAARDWTNVSGDTLTLIMADTRTGTETSTAVSLPPGALGKHIELATLVVRAY